MYGNGEEVTFSVHVNRISDENKLKSKNLFKSVLFKSRSLSSFPLHRPINHPYNNNSINNNNNTHLLQIHLSSINTSLTSQCHVSHFPSFSSTTSNLGCIQNGQRSSLLSHIHYLPKIPRKYFNWIAMAF